MYLHIYASLMDVTVLRFTYGSLIVQNVQAAQQRKTLLISTHHDTDGDNRGHRLVHKVVWEFIGALFVVSSSFEDISNELMTYFYFHSSIYDT